MKSVTVTLSAGVNWFTGTIPHNITELTSLRELWLEDTLISGELPNDIGSLKSLGTNMLFHKTAAFKIKSALLTGPSFIPPNVLRRPKPEWPCHERQAS